MVRRPCSMPELTTAKASRGGSAARTCSTTLDRSAERALSTLTLFPVRDNKSLRLLGFCIATRQYAIELIGKTVRKSLFCVNFVHRLGGPLRAKSRSSVGHNAPVKNPMPPLVE